MAYDIPAIQVTEEAKRKLDPEQTSWIRQRRKKYCRTCHSMESDAVGEIMLSLLAAVASSGCFFVFYGVAVECYPAYGNPGWVGAGACLLAFIVLVLSFLVRYLWSYVLGWWLHTYVWRRIFFGPDHRTEFFHALNGTLQAFNRMREAQRAAAVAIEDGLIAYDRLSADTESVEFFTESLERWAEYADDLADEEGTGESETDVDLETIRKFIPRIKEMKDSLCQWEGHFKKLLKGI